MFFFILIIVIFLFFKFSISKFFFIFKNIYFKENEEFILYQIYTKFFLYKNKKNLFKAYQYSYISKKVILEILHENRKNSRNMGDLDNENMIHLDVVQITKNLDRQNMAFKFLFFNNTKTEESEKKHKISEFYLRDFYYYFLLKQKRVFFKEYVIKAKITKYKKRYGETVVNSLSSGNDELPSKIKILKIRKSYKKF
jgi:hypothetical protein